MKITQKQAMQSLVNAIEKTQHTHSGRDADLDIVRKYCNQSDESTAAPAPKKKAAKKKTAKS